MSVEYVTLARGDAEFDAYLMGTFSDVARALPIESYQRPTTRERVTFRVIPLDEIRVPHWWVVYAAASRPDLIPLTLGPALVTWLDRGAGGSGIPTWVAATAILGVFFLHVAAFVINDVEDHVRGADRLNRRRGSRVIQNGWSTAAAMRRWARLNAALAVACGLPALVHAPAPLAGVCLAAAFALSVVNRNRGTRWGACDLALVALFGPLLASGVALASRGRVGAEDLAIGVTFGFATLWVMQIRQFENLFRARPESFRTFLGHLNFDGARWTAVAEGVLLLMLEPVAAVIVRVPLVMLALLPFFGLPSLVLMQRLSRASSPLSSDLVGSNRRALLAHFAFALWWLLAVGLAWA